MSAARERILGRVRDAVSGGREDGWRAELERRIDRVPPHIRPKLPGDLFAHFREKLAQGGGTFEQCDTLDEAPAAISAYLQTNGVVGKIRVAPALQEMAWGEGLEVSYGDTRGDHLVSVTPVFCAVAETGSVVLLSSDKSPTSLNFLPDVHIVIVDKDQLVSHIEDVWLKLRALDKVPRTVNFITGPSKTADVEQTLQIGAHGPRDLHVILIAK